MGRRIAAWLCVLLVHVLVINALLMDQPVTKRVFTDSFASEPITLYLEPPVDEPSSAVAAAPHSVPTRPRAAAPAPTSVGESATITVPERVDWPIEAKKSAARVLAAELEAERVAKMFAGPDGTWASLTERQRSKLKKFRWKPGVTGPEKDSKGNIIYRLPNGCFLVNMSFIGCAIGKDKIHGDLFDDMRLYFDEQRLPETNEGNGTELEAQPPR
ncbi:MAG: hypothetical protein ABI769_06610 [Pseudomonadota bacterium]